MLRSSSIPSHPSTLSHSLAPAFVLPAWLADVFLPRLARRTSPAHTTRVPTAPVISSTPMQTLVAQFVLHATAASNFNSNNTHTHTHTRTSTIAPQTTPNTSPSPSPSPSPSSSSSSSPPSSLSSPSPSSSPTSLSSQPLSPSSPSPPPSTTHSTAQSSSQPVIPRGHMPSSSATTQQTSPSSSVPPTGLPPPRPLYESLYGQIGRPTPPTVNGNEAVMQHNSHLDGARILHGLRAVRAQRERQRELQEKERKSRDGARNGWLGALFSILVIAINPFK